VATIDSYSDIKDWRVIYHQTSGERLHDRLSCLRLDAFAMVQYFDYELHAALISSSFLTYKTTGNCTFLKDYRMLTYVP
jgi:hypothetical protein